MIAAMLALVLAGAAANVRLEAQAQDARIGEPVRWTLTIEHPADARVVLPKEGLVLDGSWVLLDTGLVLRSIEPDGSATTRASWSVMSLEPGERTLPPIDVEIGGEVVHVEGTALTVRSELAPDENEPRPIRGFLPPPERTGARAWLPLFLALAAFLVTLAIWRWRARARRRVVAATVPTPLEELAALRARARSEPDAARKITYAAVALLRRAVDGHLGETRDASPDDEWLRRLEPDERVPLGVRSAAARIVRDAEHVKYALAMPTPFALEEMLSSTESALAALAAAPPLAQAVEVAA
jgi:hypothetical protein